jgi:hypothetical protein
MEFLETLFYGCVGIGYLGAIHYFFTSPYGCDASCSQVVGSGAWLASNTLAIGLLGLSRLIYGLQSPTPTVVTIYFFTCLTQLLIFVAAPVPEPP